MAKKDRKFEEALVELEAIVKKLESEEADLDQAVEFFEKGTELAKFCSEKLNEAQKKIQILVEKENGKMELEDFEN